VGNALGEPKAKVKIVAALREHRRPTKIPGFPRWSQTAAAVQPDS